MVSSCSLSLCAVISHPVDIGVCLQLLEAFAGNLALKSGEREAGETLVRQPFRGCPFDAGRFRLQCCGVSKTTCPCRESVGLLSFLLHFTTIRKDSIIASLAFFIEELTIREVEFWRLSGEPLMLIQ